MIVSTPQDIALKDAVKGIKMFQKVDVPVCTLSVNTQILYTNGIHYQILGMIQNMSVFTCPNCHESTHLFGSDGVVQACAKHGLNLLGDIPLHSNICSDADRGKPTVVAEPESERAKIFMNIANSLAETLGI